MPGPEPAVGADPPIDVVVPPLPDVPVPVVPPTAPPPAPEVPTDVVPAVGVAAVPAVALPPLCTGPAPPPAVGVEAVPPVPAVGEPPDALPAVDVPLPAAPPSPSSGREDEHATADNKSVVTENKYFMDTGLRALTDRMSETAPSGNVATSQSQSNESHAKKRSFMSGISPRRHSPKVL
ncbi:MAG TPA: hypothetical protein VEQ59_04925, partial [Polyangiaceae bacterium]|nr:hypothetical protein [Polyangiaceae bacterium]